MKKLTITLTLCLGLLLAGCGGSDKPEANSTTKTEPTTKTETTTSAAETGVPACDEYLAKVEKFVNNPNVPQATKDAYKQNLEQNRTAWKQAASTAQGKQQLESSCKMALEAAKPAFDQFGK